MNDCNENINQSTESLIKSSKVPTRTDFKAALKKNSTQTHGALGNRQGCVIIIKPI